MTEHDEETWAIDDPRVPDVVREHARRFRNPAVGVVALGGDEYLLFGADGELLDGVILESDAPSSRQPLPNNWLPASVTFTVLGVLVLILAGWIWAVG